jgi:hypothetical protein
MLMLMNLTRNNGRPMVAARYVNLTFCIANAK